MYGKGEKLLLCLHGFGENGNSFSFLEKFIGHQYTILAIDLPFNGNTEWNEKLNFTPEDLNAIIQLIKPNAYPFTLLGYSMGGRIALHFFEKYPSLINQVILIAPDGIYQNTIYWFATHTWLGNKIFHTIIKKPKWLLQLVRLSHSFKIINGVIKKYLLLLLSSSHNRMLLYNRWMSLRMFRPDWNKIQNLTRVHKTPLNILMGIYDSFIIYKKIKKRIGSNSEYVHIKALKIGHQLLQKEFLTEIITLLKG